MLLNVKVMVPVVKYTDLIMVEGVIKIKEYFVLAELLYVEKISTESHF